MIGSNCVGAMSPAGHVNAAFPASMHLPGHVAFLSQSGALFCTTVHDWCLTENVGFSALVSPGSWWTLSGRTLFSISARTPTQSAA